MTHTPPEPVRFHADGWTPDVRSVFLDALMATGSVREAAHAAGKAPSSAYRLRGSVNGAAFKADWQHAIEVCCERVHETALDRALNGELVAVYYRGNQIGTRRVYNDKVLIALMRLYDAPAYHARQARAAEAAKLAPPPPMTQVEMLAKFEGVMAKVRAQAAARDAALAELARDEAAGWGREAADGLGDWSPEESPKAVPGYTPTRCNDPTKPDYDTSPNIESESPKADGSDAAGALEGSADAPDWSGDAPSTAGSSSFDDEGWNYPMSWNSDTRAAHRQSHYRANDYTAEAARQRSG